MMMIPLAPLFIVSLLSAAAVQCFAVVVYQVGDSDGWTVGKDLSQWSSNKSFHVGDTIVFIYNPEYHNVEEVTKEDYHECNSASPIKTYNSGHDNITITNSGHFYYICGFPGHCNLSQKVDIRVPKPDGAAPAPSSPPPAAAGNRSAAQPAATPSNISAPAPEPKVNGASDRGPGFALAFAGILGFILS